MKPRVHVIVSNATGVPFARVPHAHMWSLVEFLSVRRESVRYTYADDHFTVQFLHLSPEHAQKLLDEWSTSADVLQEA